MLLSKQQQTGVKKKTPKRKRCKLESCKNLFTPERDMQPCCSFKCESDYVNKNLGSLIKTGKQNRVKEAKKVKKKLNEKTVLKKSVQDLAQKYGRLREIARGNIFCVTCGTPNIKDGGHFLPKSTYPSIRYYTLQINPQCVYCNQYNGGAPKEYKEYMIKRFGVEKVKWLESQHRVSRSYSIEYLRKYFKVMNKRLKLIESRG